MALFQNMGLASADGAAAPGPGPAPKRPRGLGGAAPDGIEQIAKTMAELLCINSAKIRTIEGALYFTYIIGADQPMFIKLLETGKNYNEGVRGKKDHKLGSPHISLAGCIISHAHTIVDDNDKETQTKFSETIKNTGRRVGSC